jgi:hypothetical protein
LTAKGFDSAGQQQEEGRGGNTDEDGEHRHDGAPTKKQRQRHSGTAEATTSLLPDSPSLTPFTDYAPRGAFHPVNSEVRNNSKERIRRVREGDDGCCCRCQWQSILMVASASQVAVSGAQ